MFVILCVYIKVWDSLVKLNINAIRSLARPLSLLDIYKYVYNISIYTYMYTHIGI